MPKIYRGIDIAGDQGETGFVDLVEEDDGRLWARCDEVDLTGREGLEALLRINQGEQLVSAAIDQALGFPAWTLRLLAWPEQVAELQTYDAKRGRYREADLEMREDLDGLNRDYVRPPVVCDNIWRAVYLVLAAGGDVKFARRGEPPWFETHPRLCVLGLLRHTNEAISLLAQYKENLSARTTYIACRPLLEAMRKNRLLPSCFYRDCLEHIYQRQGFRSVLAGTIASAVDGWFGRDEVPPVLQQRVQRGQLFLWPLMAMLWAFDVDLVASRSLIAKWIRECQTVAECYAALDKGRSDLGGRLRDVENFPRHEEMRGGSILG